MTRPGSNKFQKRAVASKFSQTTTVCKQQKYLPMFNLCNQMPDVICKKSVVVVVGNTGLDKTTKITQYFVDEGHCNYRTVACMQPRRVAATSVAKQVIKELAAVTYIVNTSFCKLKVYSPHIGMDALHVTPVSRNNTN